MSMPSDGATHEGWWGGRIFSNASKAVDPTKKGIVYYDAFISKLFMAQLSIEVKLEDTEGAATYQINRQSALKFFFSPKELEKGAPINDATLAQKIKEYYNDQKQKAVSLNTSEPKAAEEKVVATPSKPEGKQLNNVSQSAAVSEENEPLKEKREVPSPSSVEQDKAQSLASLKSRIEQIKAPNKAFEEQITGLLGKINGSDLDVEELELDIEELELDVEVFKEEVNEIEAKIGQLTVQKPEKIAEYIRQIVLDEIDDEFSSINSSSTDELKKLKDRITELETNKDGIAVSEEVENLLQEKKRIQEEIGSLQKEINALKEKNPIGSAKTALEQLEKELKANSDLLSSVSKERVMVQKDMAGVDGALQGMKGDLGEIDLLAFPRRIGQQKASIEARAQQFRLVQESLQLCKKQLADIKKPSETISDKAQQPIIEQATKGLRGIEKKLQELSSKENVNELGQLQSRLNEIKEKISPESLQAVGERAKNELQALLKAKKEVENSLKTTKAYAEALQQAGQDVSSIQQDLSAYKPISQEALEQEVLSGKQDLKGSFESQKGDIESKQEQLKEVFTQLQSKFEEDLQKVKDQAAKFGIDIGSLEKSVQFHPNESLASQIEGFKRQSEGILGGVKSAETKVAAQKAEAERQMQIAQKRTEKFSELQQQVDLRKEKIREREMEIERFPEGISKNIQLAQLREGKKELEILARAIKEQSALTKAPVNETEKFDQFEAQFTEIFKKTHRLELEFVGRTAQFRLDALLAEKEKIRELLKVAATLPNTESVIRTLNAIQNELNETNLEKKIIGDKNWRQSTYASLETQEAAIQTQQEKLEELQKQAVVQGKESGKGWVTNMQTRLQSVESALKTADLSPDALIPVKKIFEEISTQILRVETTLNRGNYDLESITRDLHGAIAKTKVYESELSTVIQGLQQKRIEAFDVAAERLEKKLAKFDGSKDEFLLGRLQFLRSSMQNMKEKVGNLEVSIEKALEPIESEYRELKQYAEVRTYCNKWEKVRFDGTRFKNAAKTEVAHLEQWLKSGITKEGGWKAPKESHLLFEGFGDVFQGIKGNNFKRMLVLLNDGAVTGSDDEQRILLLKQQFQSEAIKPPEKEYEVKLQEAKDKISSYFAEAEAFINGLPEGDDVERRKKAYVQKLMGEVYSEVDNFLYDMTTYDFKKLPNLKEEYNKFH